MTTPTNKGDALPYKAVPIESFPSFWCVIDAAGTRITEQAMEEPAAHRTAKYLNSAWQAGKQSIQVQDTQRRCARALLVRIVQLAIFETTPNDKQP